MKADATGTHSEQVRAAHAWQRPSDARAQGVPITRRCLYCAYGALPTQGRGLRCNLLGVATAQMATCNAHTGSKT